MLIPKEREAAREQQREEKEREEKEAAAKEREQVRTLP